MTRQRRLEFAGAFFSLRFRRNRSEMFFESGDDRRTFLSVFDEVCETFNRECGAYCLMSNHCHLLIETPEGNLPESCRYIELNPFRAFMVQSAVDWPWSAYFGLFVRQNARPDPVFVFALKPAALSQMQVELSSVALVDIDKAINPFMTDHIIRAFKPQSIGDLFWACRICVHWYADHRIGSLLALPCKGVRCCCA